MVEGVEKATDLQKLVNLQTTGEKGAERDKVVDGNRAAIESTAVNATDKVGSGDAGQNSISGAIVPVAEALARVVQDLMDAKNTVLDRGISGESKDSAIESGQIQLMMDDSAVAAAVRAIFTKNNAAVAEQLESNVALNTTGSRPKAGIVKTTVAQDTAVQGEEQQLEDVDASCSTATGVEPVVGHIKARQEQTNSQQVQGEKKKGTGVVEASAHSMYKEAAGVEIAGDTTGGIKPTVTLDFEASQYATPTGSKVVNVEDMSIAKGDEQVFPRQSATAPNKSNTKSKKWTVVNKSPNKKHQIVPSNVIGVSNSFEALVNESDQDVDKNKEQQKGDETQLVDRKTRCNYDGEYYFKKWATTSSRQ
ncbi:hypothetical protein A4A49_22771 [Nicotiana attenuata]|uniref:Uncharacterized protein n=1 Tax=Nicotiana attenuata TaxID=49451 RepID=A0A314LFX0_NICAT|nr:hypothetical protein A4A49_22771 [Nicotiana attenuata]